LSIDILKDLDIIVINYIGVIRQIPFLDQKTLNKIRKHSYTNWLKKVYNQLDPLYKILRYCIVLDKVYTIKNNIGQTRIAYQNLKSLYK